VDTGIERHFIFAIVYYLSGDLDFLFSPGIEGNNHNMSSLQNQLLTHHKIWDCLWWSKDLLANYSLWCIRDRNLQAFQ